MPAHHLAFLAVVLSTLPMMLTAQSTRLGLSGGISFVGGSASMTGVDINGTAVTGADRQGNYFSVFLERHGDSGPLGMRLESFYSGLTSGPKTSGTRGRSALTDETLGLAATFSYSLRNGAGFTPYTLLGAGVYATMLGTNPDPAATEVSDRTRGMGMGIHMGLGVEWSVQRTRLFAEGRFQQALHQKRGAAFMPFVVGLKL
jgi:hypothetical protein